MLHLHLPADHKKALLETLKGSHDKREAGLCAMEWVAYLAGEEHSDSPQCVDPVLRRFSIGLNDNLPDDLRQQLRPYLARMIGTTNEFTGINVLARNMHGKS